MPTGGAAPSRAKSRRASEAGCIVACNGVADMKQVICLTEQGERRMGRPIFFALAAAIGLAGAATAQAQTYPTRTVSLIVPYAAGGGLDATARLVAAALTKTLGQQVIVENKP